MEELICSNYDTYSQIDELARIYGLQGDMSSTSDNEMLSSSILQIAPLLFIDFPEDSPEQDEVADVPSQEEGKEDAEEEEKVKEHVNPEHSDEPALNEESKKQPASNTSDNTEPHEKVKRHDSKGMLKQYIKQQQQQPSFEQYLRQRKQFQERKEQTEVDKQEQQIVQEQQSLDELSFMAQQLKSSTAAISTVIQNDKTVLDELEAKIDKNQSKAKTETDSLTFVVNETKIGLLKSLGTLAVVIFFFFLGLFLMSFFPKST